MRSPETMLALILDAARKDPRIRAVSLNGSRADPDAPKDAFRDFDVVFSVTETAPFLADRRWLAAFGTPLLTQEPDAVDAAWGEAPDPALGYTWLMLFDDGNRIDLHIEPVTRTLENWGKDSLTVLLLDKDGTLPALPPSSDAGYRLPRPTQAQFWACCNEFWWCMNNVIKGIARDELPYAHAMWNGPVRDMLDRMLVWKIGFAQGFPVSAGKSCKYFRRLLSPADYAAYAETYSSFAGLTASARAGCALFSRVLHEVAAAGGFSVRESEEAGLRRYWEMADRGEIG